MSVIINGGLYMTASINGVAYSETDVARMLAASKECRDMRTRPGRPADFDRCDCCLLAAAVLKRLRLR